MAWIKTITVLLLGLFLNSCGIYSLSGASISPEMKTFSVVQFPNNAEFVAPQLAQVLSDKMRNKILTETRLSMVPNAGDAHFEGAIVGYTVAPSSVVAGERTSVNRLTIRVKVSFVNAKDPKQNFEQEFSRFADFTRPTLAEVENQLIDEITKQLVDDIFNRTFINW